MKLFYEPKWEIQDERVEKLDYKRMQLNKLYSLIDMEVSANPCVSPSL
ncbi:hypothetical protein KY308_03140 [Candidatus Woesearchaeota archaeon]|nr:hypothetical protein [Candidatus Woesearchaeota archaeon]